MSGDMPHSLEAEQALLGCLLLDTKIQVEIEAFLSEDDFYTEAHKNIFSAMRSIIKSNQSVDLVTLLDALEKAGTLEQAGGISYITELTNVLPSSANYLRYLNIVRRDSTLRKLIVGASDIVSECKTSVDEKSALAYAEKTVYELSNQADTSEIVQIDKIIPEVITKLDDVSKNKNATAGIKTQFKSLDYLINGLHKSDLMIIAARPGVGKTSFAMNIVENVARQGYSCAVFSLEMGKEQLAQRMLCSVAGVSMENAVKGNLSKSEWLKIAKAREILSNSKIFIDDSSMITPREALSKCRRLKRKYGLDLVMVDYVQLMSPDKSKNSDSRQNEITEISRNLKILAKEINVPVLALSQLSRASEKEKRRPQLSDLRESGAIEQDADMVLFIHRPDIGASEKDYLDGKIKKNVAEIHLAKHRNGPQGRIKLYFRGECTKFINLNEETEEPEFDQEDNIKAPSNATVQLKSINEAIDSSPDEDDIF